MSEKILKALMQLFAIIAKSDGVTNHGRQVVTDFLRQQLSQERVSDYLTLFDQFSAEAPEKRKPREGVERRTSVKDSVRVLRICTQINAELEQKQKLVVLIRILEFIRAGEAISEQELEFASTVASTFNIPNEEFENIKALVSKDIGNIQSRNLLLISPLAEPDHQYKFIPCEALLGRLAVLRINSVDMLVIQYQGEGEVNLNGSSMQPGTVYVLNPGSSIRNSKINTLYYSDILGCLNAFQSGEHLIYDVDAIEYVFKNGHQGLHSLSFTGESGRMIGIMGASGAGKSTLLNILNGIDKPTRGQVLINGVDLHRDKKSLQGVIGYVSQDDLLMEELSVYENLFYNAKLCFGGFSEEQIRERVDRLLLDIGLFEIRELKVGSPLNKKISGGQRKRLNIGLELIREPAVLFVDEPTSGLSSRDSENIMDLLKELSLKGKLVFVVIHQPSSDIFKMFDQLLLLDTGGYPIYLGNPVESLVYFKRVINHVNCEESECSLCGNVNPELIFNIIESKVIDEYGVPTRERRMSAKAWNKLFKERIGTPEKHKGIVAPLPKNAFHVPSKFSQFRVFLTRDILSKLSNLQYVLINSLEAPLLAFILAFMVRYISDDQASYIFRQNENLPAYIFMAVIVALFMGLTVSAEEIIRDRKNLKREAFLNLSRSSYLYSKVLILFGISALQTLCFVLVGNYILEIKGMHLTYWFVLFTTSCFANMLGLNVSATFNSAVTIYILIPILLIPQLLLSGVIVKFDKLNPSIASDVYVPFTGDMMTSRWAFEAIAVEQFSNNAYERNFYEQEKKMADADYHKTYWLPKMREKLDFCEENLQKNTNGDQVSKELRLIQSELDKELQHFPAIDKRFLEQMEPALCKAETFQAARELLDRLQQTYIHLYNKQNELIDAKIADLTGTPERKAVFEKLKNEHENESLNDLVKNTKEIVRIKEVDSKLIQKINPVFMDPNFAGDLDFRAHFYAPRKQFMGFFFDTFAVNMAVVWSLSLVLYFTLYFEFFRQLPIVLSGFFGVFKKREGQ